MAWFTTFEENLIAALKPFAEFADALSAHDRANGSRTFFTLAGRVIGENGKVKLVTKQLTTGDVLKAKETLAAIEKDSNLDKTVYRLCREDVADVAEAKGIELTLEQIDKIGDGIDLPWFDIVEDLLSETDGIPAPKDDEAEGVNR